MRLCTARGEALLGVLFLSVFNLSECLRTAVQPDKDSVVTVSTDLPADKCNVCTVSGVNDTQTSCHSSLSLVPEQEVTLLFTCSQPVEQAFNVKITRSIECTTDSCSPTTGDVQSSILSEFSRTFTWNLKAPGKTVVVLQFLGNGLKETSQPESCPDGFQYSVDIAKSTGTVQTQAYCVDGSLTHLDLPNQAAVSLKVKPKANVLPVVFQASAKPWKGRTMDISLDPGTTVQISRDSEDPECNVCFTDGSNPTCSPTNLTMSKAHNTPLEFSCPQPQDLFTAQIKKKIECTNTSCSPAKGIVHSNLFKEFKRSLTWDIRIPEKTVLMLEFAFDGAKETTGPDKCQDGYDYSLSTTTSKGAVNTKTYCRTGPVFRVKLLGMTTVTIDFPKGGELAYPPFFVTAAPRQGRTMDVSLDPGTTVRISRDSEDPECNVCFTDGSNPTCSTTNLTMSKAQNMPLEFSCPQPQDLFTAQIKKKIECTKTSCSPAKGVVHPNLFKEFKRSLTWDISIPEKTVLILEFAFDGAKETTGPDKCQDGYDYSLSTTTSKGAVNTKTYCRTGPVFRVKLLGMTTVTIDFPKGGELGYPPFFVTAAPRRSRMMSVTPDPDTSVIVRRQTEEPDCSVCVGEEPTQKCDPTALTLKDARNTSVEFTCPQPQDVFNVEINREIDCTETTCSGNIVQAESSLFPDFNRTFTWDLKVTSDQAFRMDFPEPGMRQIPNGETCPDEHTYTIVTYLRSGPATIGTYCKGGTMTTIQVRYKGRMLLEVPGNRKLEPLDFKLSVGLETNMLAIVKINLPRGVSDTDFFSANYPSNFPDSQQMRWDFIMPGMHNYTIRFLNHTAPECLNKEVMVEYQKEGKKGASVPLTDPQLKHKQGDFHMSLFNCETNTTLQGLNLHFRVSLMRSGHPVLCTVDLTKNQGVSLQIEKVGSDPYCEMRLDSVVKKKINVTVGSKASLSFLDCTNEDVQLTANKIIGCQNLNSCSVSGTLLTVPKLDSCLPMPLHSFTWYLNIPADGTVELVSPTGTLRQSLPGQECGDSASLHVAKGDGSSIGDFCSNGIIQKVQVHSDVSVTVRDIAKTKGPFLNVSFSEEISESIIYRVSPVMSSPAVLATPNWPGGMKPFSTVSWIVTLPRWYQAAMQFVNISQPKCSQRHTGIKVQTLGSEEEILSRREDEEPEALVVPESFYLNMSNCMPEEGHFGVVTKVILQKKTNLLAIILGIAGALLLLLLVLVVVCLVLKKKKTGKMSTESSIYVGKGNIFRPGERHFSKTRSDNDSHVYASIDEMMVYGHLLPDSSYADSIQDHFKGMQVDSYHTFTGPTDGNLPVINEPDPDAAAEMDEYKTFLDPSETFIPSRPRTPIDRQDSLGFQDRRMVDNELYTFKTTGEMNTFRLSAADMEPQPMVDAPREDSL